MQKYLVEAKENSGSSAKINLANKIDSSQVTVSGSPRKPLTPVQRKLGKALALEHGKHVEVPISSSPNMIAIDSNASATEKSSFDRSVEASKSSNTLVGIPNEYKISSVLGENVSKSKKYCKPSIYDTTDLDFMTGETAPLEYWKQLAEQRRLALEETLNENKILTEKIVALETDNRNLEEMLEEAKTLAEMINAFSSEANDSGIVTDSTFNTSTI